MAQARPSNVFAVCIGRVPGIYTDWGMCYQTMQDYPRGTFSTFRTVEPAILFMKSNGHRKITLYTETKNVILVDDEYPIPNNNAESMELERIHRQRVERQLQEAMREYVDFGLLHATTQPQWRT
jgi:viroplasmin and RNaseH domain-containing protein